MLSGGCVLIGVLDLGSYYRSKGCVKSTLFIHFMRCKRCTRGYFHDSIKIDHIRA